MYFNFVMFVQIDEMCLIVEFYGIWHKFINYLKFGIHRNCSKILIIFCNMIWDTVFVRSRLSKATIWNNNNALAFEAVFSLFVISCCLF